MDAHACSCAAGCGVVLGVWPRPMLQGAAGQAAEGDIFRAPDAVVGTRSKNGGEEEPERCAIAAGTRGHGPADRVQSRMDTGSVAYSGRQREAGTLRGHSGDSGDRERRRGILPFLPSSWSLAPNGSRRRAAQLDPCSRPGQVGASSGPGLRVLPGRGCLCGCETTRFLSRFEGALGVSKSRSRLGPPASVCG
jgi:hypothetical protein